MGGRPTLLVLTALLLAGCNDSFHFDVSSDDASPPDAGTSDVVLPSPCTDDTACPLAGLHCDVSSGTCVACASDDHCVGVSGRPRCDTALHRCVECGDNQDCGNLSFCESSVHLCVRVCSEESGCVAPSKHCDESNQRCFECTSNSECKDAARPRCELLTGRCVTCTNNTHCSGATPRCDVATFTCVECVNGADCASGVCDPSTLTCVH